MIGLTLRVQAGQDSLPKVALNRTYFAALRSAGAEVLPIPALSDVSADTYYEMVDGLLIPGGPDVEPARYHEAQRADANVHVNHDLDEMEFALLERALADGMPVLAICRGIQVLNVACGGTLWQDLHVQGATQRPHDCEPRDSLVHDMEIEPDSVLAQTIGATRVAVNSLHHQAIRDLGGSLRAVGVTDDKLIEAVEMPDRRFVVGIQCHPEELVNKATWPHRLFAVLVDAAADYRRLRSQGRTRSAR